MLYITTSFHAVVEEKYSQFEIFSPFMDNRKKSL